MCSTYVLWSFWGLAHIRKVALYPIRHLSFCSIKCFLPVLGTRCFIITYIGLTKYKELMCIKICKSVLCHFENDFLKGSGFIVAIYTT